MSFALLTLKALGPDFQSDPCLGEHVSSLFGHGFLSLYTTVLNKAHKMPKTNHKLVYIYLPLSTYFGHVMTIKCHQNVQNRLSTSSSHLDT